MSRSTTEVKNSNLSSEIAIKIESPDEYEEDFIIKEEILSGDESEMEYGDEQSFEFVEVHESDSQNIDQSSQQGGNGNSYDNVHADNSSQQEADETAFITNNQEKGSSVSKVHESTSSPQQKYMLVCDKNAAGNNLLELKLLEKQSSIKEAIVQLASKVEDSVSKYRGKMKCQLPTGKSILQHPDTNDHGDDSKVSDLKNSNSLAQQYVLVYDNTVIGLVCDGKVTGNNSDLLKNELEITKCSNSKKGLNPTLELNHKTKRIETELPNSWQAILKAKEEIKNETEVSEDEHMFKCTECDAKFELKSCLLMHELQHDRVREAERQKRCRYQYHGVTTQSHNRNTKTEISQNHGGNKKLLEGCNPGSLSLGNKKPFRTFESKSERLLSDKDSSKTKTMCSYCGKMFFNVTKQGTTWMCFACKKNTNSSTFIQIPEPKATLRRICHSCGKMSFVTRFLESLLCNNCKMIQFNRVRNKHTYKSVIVTSNVASCNVCCKMTQNALRFDRNWLCFNCWKANYPSKLKKIQRLEQFKFKHNSYGRKYCGETYFASTPHRWCGVSSKSGNRTHSQVKKRDFDKKWHHFLKASSELTKQSKNEHIVESHNTLRSNPDVMSDDDFEMEEVIFDSVEADSVNAKDEDTGDSSKVLLCEKTGKLLVV